MQEYQLLLGLPVCNKNLNHSGKKSIFSCKARCLQGYAIQGWQRDVILKHLVSGRRLPCPYCVVSIRRVSLWLQMALSATAVRPMLQASVLQIMAQGRNYLLLVYHEISIETESNHLEILQLFDFAAASYCVLSKYYSGVDRGRMVLYHSQTAEGGGHRGKSQDRPFQSVSSSPVQQLQFTQIFQGGCNCFGCVPVMEGFCY